MRWRIDATALELHLIPWELMREVDDDRRCRSCWTW